MASEIARRGHPFPPKSPPSNRGNRDRASRPDSARTSPEATGWRRGRKWGDSESGNPRFPPRDAGRRPLLMKIEQRSNAGNARFDFRSLTVLRQDKLCYNSLSLSLSLSLSYFYFMPSRTFGLSTRVCTSPSSPFRHSRRARSARKGR
jgi:hypothetical protein